jgi:hypothetical protein
VWFAKRTTHKPPRVGPSAYGPGKAVNELNVRALKKMRSIPKTAKISALRLRLSCCEYLVEIKAAITPI